MSTQESKALQIVEANRFSLADMQTMANAMSKSRLFPSCQTPENALALMLLCQSEGIHPAQAARRFHVINGTVTMRSDAMLAEFQRQGGTVRWIRYDAEEARAVLSHPVGGEIEFSYTIAEAKKAGLVRNGGNWEKYPAAMLRSRVISGGIRMVLPGIVCGIYAPEEIGDVNPEPDQGTKKTVADAIASKAKKQAAPVVAEAVPVFEFECKRCGAISESETKLTECPHCKPEPEATEQPPAAPPAPAQVEEKKPALRFYACLGCMKPQTVESQLVQCKCGSKNVTECKTLKEANEAIAAEAAKKAPPAPAATGNEGAEKARLVDEIVSIRTQLQIADGAFMAYCNQAFGRPERNSDKWTLEETKKMHARIKQVADARKKA